MPGKETYLCYAHDMISNVMVMHQNDCEYGVGIVKLENNKEYKKRTAFSWPVWIHVFTCLIVWTIMSDFLLIWRRHAKTKKNYSKVYGWGMAFVIITSGASFAFMTIRNLERHTHWGQEGAYLSVSAINHYLFAYVVTGGS